MMKGWLSRPKQLIEHRPTLLVVGTVLVGVVFILLLWKIPEWQTPSGITAVERAQLLNESRKTVAQVALGLLVLGSLFVGWRRVRAAERTTEIAGEQQITERFTRAIDQLGNEQSMAIRLGGIYAMERIAKDSERDHWQVMEVLTAYVRENARWRGEADYDDVPVSDDSAAHIVPTDIQAILTVLGRRIVEQDSSEQRLYLTSTDLSRASLSMADLRGASLFSANLQRAALLRANLQGTIFVLANLQGANFTGANLQGARFALANLRGANFTGAIGLTQEEIDSANTDEHTILPDYLKREE